MKYCQKCGQALQDGVSFCPECGTLLSSNTEAQVQSANQSAPAGEVQTYNVQATVYQTDQLYPVSESDKTLRLIAFIFNLLMTIGCGIIIIPLAWMIPMTVVSWGIYKGKKRNTVAFGVCDLLFLNVISGILLLCSHKDN